MRPAEDDPARSTAADPAAAPKVRRRVRVALRAQLRIAEQRKRLASDYGMATTPEERFVVATNAFRAAAAEGTHQVDGEAVAVVVERLTESVMAALTELHNVQEEKARKTIQKDQQRISSSERRRHVGAGNHPRPERPGAGSHGG